MLRFTHISGQPVYIDRGEIAAIGVLRNGTGSELVLKNGRALEVRENHLKVLRQYKMGRRS